MIKSTLAAALLLAAGIGGANAASLPMTAPLLGDAGVIQAQFGPGSYRDRDRDRGRRPPPPPRWVPGHRYDRSPPGWHRHHRRPYDWRRRGCVIVGPVWFCP